MRLTMKEINDYLSKYDDDLAKSINYRVYGIDGPLPEGNEGDTPTPPDPPPTPVPPSNLIITCSENTVTISAENADLIEYRFNEEENWIIYTEPFNITQTVTVYAKATNEGGTTTVSSVCEYVQPTIPNDRIILYFSKGDSGSLFIEMSGEAPDGSMFDYMIIDGVEYHEDFWSEYIYFDNPDIIHKVQLVLKSNQPQPLPDKTFYMTGASSVIIPSSITSIGDYSFFGSSCYSYVFPTTPPVLGRYAIEVSTSTVIYVPASSVEAYKSAEGWEEYTDYIQPIQ